MYVGGWQRDVIAEVLTRYNISSFTMYESHGMWKGEREASTVVEILAESELSDIKFIARMMGKELSPVQECILVTSTDVSGELVDCEPLDEGIDRFRNQL